MSTGTTPAWTAAFTGGLALYDNKRLNFLNVSILFCDGIFALNSKECKTRKQAINQNGAIFDKHSLVWYIIPYRKHRL